MTIFMHPTEDMRQLRCTAPAETGERQAVSSLFLYDSAEDDLHISRTFKDH